MPALSSLEGLLVLYQDYLLSSRQLEILGLTSPEFIIAISCPEHYWGLGFIVIIVLGL